MMNPRCENAAGTSFEAKTELGGGREGAHVSATPLPSHHTHHRSVEQDEEGEKSSGSATQGEGGASLFQTDTDTLVPRCSDLTRKSQPLPYSGTEP